jgi:hypothetical protein
MLSGIDLYGDTIFNRLQMPRFLSEWRKLPQMHERRKSVSWYWRSRAWPVDVPTTSIIT